MTKAQKTYLYIGIGLLLIMTIVAIWFYRKGKKTVTNQYVPGDLPGSTGPNNNPAGASNAEILNIANGLYADMKGLNWGFHNNDPYNAAALLSDTDIVKLYNAFNAKFQPDSQQTLTKWIKAETGYGDWVNVAGILVARLEKLNCN